MPSNRQKSLIKRAGRTAKDRRPWRDSLIYTPGEVKLLRLRDCPVGCPLINTPEKLVIFWKKHVVTAPWFQQEKECCCVFMLNTRRHITNWCMLGIGTLDTVLVHPREVFRPVLVANAAAFLVAHNHPSSDPTPSRGDIDTTRVLIRAGRFMGIELLDHVIIGSQRKKGQRYVSLRELGYFNSSRRSTGASPRMAKETMLSESSRPDYDHQ